MTSIFFRVETTNWIILIRLYSININNYQYPPGTVLKEPAEHFGTFFHINWCYIILQIYCRGLFCSQRTHIFSSKFAFAALLADKTLVTWGRASCGGDSFLVCDSPTVCLFGIYEFPNYPPPMPSIGNMASNNMMSGKRFSLESMGCTPFEGLADQPTMVNEPLISSTWRQMIMAGDPTMLNKAIFFLGGRGYIWLGFG